jgi:hypothetical protein
MLLIYYEEKTIMNFVYILCTNLHNLDIHININKIVNI